MSGSPKYSQAEIEEERYRALVEEIRRQAEAAERARRAEEARRRRIQLEETRAVVMLGVEGLAPMFRLRTHGELAAHLPPRFEELSAAALASVRNAIVNATDATTLAEAARSVDDLARNGAQILARAREGLRLATEKVEEDRELAAVRAITCRIQVIGSAHSDEVRMQHDRAGWESTERQATLAIERFKARDFSGARRLLEALKPEVEQHMARVSERRAEWTLERDGLRVRADEVSLRLNVLAEDEITAAWVSPAIAEIRAREAVLERAVKADDIVGMRTICEEMELRMAAAVQQAEARQLEAEKRQYILNGLLKVLQSQGFAVSHPQLVDGQDFGSDIRVHAVRPDRRAVDVQVPMSGRVEYEVDGYARRVEQLSDGTVSGECEEAEERLEKLHAQLEKDFGIQMGELTWDSKAPLRRQHGAQELPTSGKARKGSGGGA